MKTIVLYHSADFDGIFCREIAKKFLPDAQLIGWDYGDPVPTVPLEVTLYMLDISVEGLMDHPNLIWIDHHKSAIEKYGCTGLHDRIAGYRIDGVAACRLAWFYFTAWERYLSEIGTAIGQPVNGGEGHRGWLQKHYPFATKSDFIDRKVLEPLAVRLAGEYDIWDRRDPDAELFQHGLRSQDLTENMWDILLSGPTEPVNGKEGLAELTVQAMLDAGTVLQYARTKENESVIKSAGFTIQFEGLMFLACNSARFNSHLFTAGLTPDHDACFGFCWSGTDWKVSLYHAPGKEHHDLSLIAVKHGGGGHKGACGFRAKSLPFLT